MRVNTTEVVDRGNRPNVSQRIGLRTYFINDGAYVDPYEVCSVKLFARSDTLSPKTVLDSDNLVSTTPLMAFGASAAGGGGINVHCTRPVGMTGTCENAFNPTNYVPGDTTASGIYRIAAGDYVVVLDQTLALSGWDYTTSTQVAASSLSSVGEYVDLWTVKLNEASKAQVITNQFDLNEDTFFAFTEPLLLTTSNKLMNKHVRLGETVDLKISTETTIQNRDISRSIQDIFKQSVVTEGEVEIRKVNQDVNFAGPFTVSSYDETGPDVRITSDNTLILNWDTSLIKDLPAFTDGTFGSLTGTYSIQVKYSLLNETIISPLFYLTVS